MLPAEIERITLYNMFHNGDLHISREFLKMLRKAMPRYRYSYAHRCKHSVFCDMPWLAKSEEHMDDRQNYLPYYYGRDGKTLYINTWVARCRSNRYSANFAMRSAIIRVFNKFRDDILELGLPFKIGFVEDCLPRIDYSYCRYGKNVMLFVKECGDKRIILVANGDAMSGQANNFDMCWAVRELADEHEDCVFVMTHRTEVAGHNIFYTDEIIQAGAEGDLCEISLLSRYCDVLVGRNSGPSCFWCVYPNWIDEHKHIIHFVNDTRDDFWHNTLGANLYCSLGANEKIFVTEVHNLIERTKNHV